MSEDNYWSGKKPKQHTNITSGYYFFWLKTNKTKIAGLILEGQLTSHHHILLSIHMSRMKTIHRTGLAQWCKLHIPRLADVENTKF